MGNVTGVSDAADSADRAEEAERAAKDAERASKDAERSAEDAAGRAEAAEAEAADQATKAEQEAVAVAVAADALLLDEDVRRTAAQVSEERPFGLPGRPIEHGSPLRYGFIFTVGGLIAFGLANAVVTVQHELLLVLLAAFIAIGLDPVAGFLVRRGLKRGVAVAVIAVVALSAVTAFVASAAPARSRRRGPSATFSPTTTKSGLWLSIRALCLAPALRGGGEGGRTLPLLLSPATGRLVVARRTTASHAKQQPAQDKCFQPKAAAQAGGSGCRAHACGVVVRAVAARRRMWRRKPNVIRDCEAMPAGGPDDRSCSSRSGREQMAPGSVGWRPDRPVRFGFPVTPVIRHSRHTAQPLLPPNRAVWDRDFHSGRVMCQATCRCQRKRRAWCQ